MKYKLGTRIPIDTQRRLGLTSPVTYGMTGILKFNLNRLLLTSNRLRRRIREEILDFHRDSQ